MYHESISFWPQGCTFMFRQCCKIWLGLGTCSICFRLEKHRILALNTELCRDKHLQQWSPAQQLSSLDTYVKLIHVFFNNKQCQRFILATELILKSGLTLVWCHCFYYRSSYYVLVIHLWNSVATRPWENECHVIGQVAKHYNELSQCGDWDWLPHSSWGCRSVLGHPSSSLTRTKIYI